MIDKAEVERLADWLDKVASAARSGDDKKAAALLRAQQREIKALRAMVPHDADCYSRQCRVCEAYKDEPHYDACWRKTEKHTNVTKRDCYKCTCTRPARLKDIALAASQGGK